MSAPSLVERVRGYDRPIFFWTLIVCALGPLGGKSPASLVFALLLFAAAVGSWFAASDSPRAAWIRVGMLTVTAVLLPFFGYAELPFLALFGAGYLIFDHGLSFTELFEAAAAKTTDDKPPIVNLTLLQREPRRIDSQTLATVAGRVFGVRVVINAQGPLDENADAVLIPTDAFTMLHLGAANVVISIFNFEQPFPPAEQGGSDAKWRRAARRHQGFLGMTCIDSGKRYTLAEQYRFVGRLLAPFVDQNVLGLCDPEQDLYVPAFPELADCLLAPDPIAALRNLA